MKKNIILTISLALFLGLYNIEANSFAAPVAQKTQQAQYDKIINTTSLNVVASPAKYLNKTVKLNACSILQQAIFRVSCTSKNATFFDMVLLFFCCFRGC